MRGVWKLIGAAGRRAVVGFAIGAAVVGAGCREPARRDEIVEARRDAGAPDEIEKPRDAGDEIDKPRDAGARVLPTTLDAALAELRADDLVAAADTIARRVAQSKPKMKLSPADGLAAARALLEHGQRPAFRALHGVMPRSTVELARAVRERDVPIAEAERIARYLAEVVRVLDFERLATFDENHSHVTGRDWPQIDYTGEGMTWQSQQADWQPRGVTDFRTVDSIHAYFTGAEKLPHWKKVYRPRGKLSAVRIVR